MKTEEIKAIKVELTEEERINLKTASKILGEVYNLIDTLGADEKLVLFEIPAENHGWYCDKTVSESEWKSMLDTIDAFVDCNELTVELEEE